MVASRRNVLLVGVGVVAWAAAASLIATTIAGPVPKTPTCGQLRDDASSQRRTMVRLTNEFESPPEVTRARRVANGHTLAWRGMRTPPS